MVRTITINCALTLSQLTRHTARTLLLMMTLAITVAAWLGLAALAAPFVGTGDTAYGSAVVTVSNARGGTAAFGSGNTLPKRYGARIAALPSVQNVHYMDLLLLTCGQSTTVTLNALGGPGSNRYLERNQVSRKLIAEWEVDPLGVLIGTKLAAACGWRAGTTVSPPSPMIPGAAVEIHIVGVTDSPKPGIRDTAVAHYAYVNRIGSLAGPDRVLFVSAFAKQPRNSNALAARIEALFVDADPPVIANTNATAQSALEEFGRVQDVLALVMLAVFLCALLVLVSITAHTAAGRRQELAVMQVLGFSRGSLFQAFALEVALVVIGGGVLGIGLGFVALAIMRGAAPPLAELLLGHFSTPAWAWQWLPAWLLALLGASLIAPAATIGRLRATDYERA